MDLEADLGLWLAGVHRASSQVAVVGSGVGSVAWRWELPWADRAGELDRQGRVPGKFHRVDSL